MTIAKHLVRRELGSIPRRSSASSGTPWACCRCRARNIKVHLHPDDAAILREKLAAPVGEHDGSSPKIRSWRAAAAA